MCVGEKDYLRDTPFNYWVLVFGPCRAREWVRWVKPLRFFSLSLVLFFFVEFRSLFLTCRSRSCNPTLFFFSSTTTIHDGSVEVESLFVLEPTIVCLVGLLAVSHDHCLFSRKTNCVIPETQSTCSNAFRVPRVGTHFF